MSGMKDVLLLGFDFETAVTMTAVSPIVATTVPSAKRAYWPVLSFNGRLKIPPISKYNLKKIWAQKKRTGWRRSLLQLRQYLWLSRNGISIEVVCGGTGIWAGKAGNA